MALLLPDNLLVMNPPKCASTWVRQAVRQAFCGRVLEVGYWHATLDDILAPNIVHVKTIISFVRHPAHWYPYAWMYYKRTGRYPRQPHEPKVEHDTYNQFLENCLRANPNGYLSHWLNRYLHCRSGRTADAICKTESVADDLKVTLKRMRIPHDPSAFDRDPINTADGQERPVADPELWEWLMRSERPLINRYYADAGLHA